MPVSIPSGVTATLDGGLVTVVGPRGRLQFVPAPTVALTQESGKITVSKRSTDRQAAADYGTARSVINNMMLGVTKGWKRALELSGVGFTAKVNGGTLVLTCGFSHEVALEIPQGISCTVTKNTVELESSDKEAVGTFAARIRKVQPPEPYLGKGIRFVEEVVRRKAGKTGKK
jgi:large subunit ribosomal protein L6